MSEPLPSYGGQAVIEGVLMRGAKSCAIAVRAPDDSIEIELQDLAKVYRSRIAKVPFLRGLLVLWDALVLGVRALAFSANIQAGEEEQIDDRAMALTLFASLVLGVGVFFVLPAALVAWLEGLTSLNPFTINLIEGLIRLLLLVAYIGLIGRVPDIRRVYGYHGAEHKTINAFEAGATLTPESVAAYPREHARCGTAFLLTLVAFSILLFSLLGPMPLYMRLITRVLFIPLLASLAYEYIRLSSRLLRFRWARPLVLPNLWLQQLTTREPDPAMIEVAIAAFNAMQKAEKQPEAEQ